MRNWAGTRLRTRTGKMKKMSSCRDGPLPGIWGPALSGGPHTILSSKFPLYRNNQIVGILGYFDDLEDTPAQQALLRELNLRDPETGFLSYRGMLETGLQYADAWRCRKEDYAACLLDIPEFDEFRQAYGMELGRKLLDKITENSETWGSRPFPCPGSAAAASWPLPKPSS